MLSLDEDILVHSSVNMLDLITKFLGFIAACCIHNNFTTIKQSLYYDNYYDIDIEGFYSMMFTRNKILTEMLKYCYKSGLECTFYK